MADNVFFIYKFVAGEWDLRYNFYPINVAVKESLIILFSTSLHGSKASLIFLNFNTQFSIKHCLLKLPLLLSILKMSEGFKLYHYDPSAGAAVAFAAVFGLTTAVHIWQLARNRTWYFVPFLIGCLCVYH
jgi:hypothetical protein